MCVAATQVGSDTFYNLSTTVSLENFGWMAIGFGDRMVGTPAVVVWPNSDNSTTLSQRKATAHASPPIDPSPPRLATLREDLSKSTATPASILFSMPSSGNATEMMVFAFGTANPRTKDAGATLIRHVWMTLLWDIGVTTLCLASSAYLYLLRHQRNASLISTGSPLSGYILTNQVVHARLLPVESKHAFSYQTMSLLLSVSALENKTLNCGWRGVIFGYPGIWGRMTGLRPQTYLRDQIGSDAVVTASIRQKLAELLRSSNMKLGEVWMMTMPSFLGFEGINPLTVYFCYEKGKADVWGIILEVHNTFGERHAYVLQVGKNEDGQDKKSQGYDHQWTFARQFHVSPFNDRSGHYVCSVIMPSHPPPSTVVRPSGPTTAPRPVIRLHLLTAPPSPQIKLVALLRPTLSEPLTALNLLATLVLPPRSSRKPCNPHLLSAIPEPSPAPWSALPLGAALLLTSLRIVYQAGLLHYQRGLAVFARPEPAAGAGREWVEQALGGVWNDIEPSNKEEFSIGGSIGWQSESPTERWARIRFEEKMNTAAKKLGITVRIASTNPLVPIILLGSQEIHARTLVLCYRSPRTWTAILVAPTAAHVLEFGSRTEHWFSVSDDDLFNELWDGCLSPNESGQIAKIIRLIRDGAGVVGGLGAWFNLTGTNYLVPCVAPAGSRLELVLQDSTGWISISRGNFVVLPSSNASCLNETFDAASLSRSQGALSTELQIFQSSVISAISVSATASATTTIVGTASATPTTTGTESSNSDPKSLGRIIGPILGSLLAVILCIMIGICLMDNGWT
ncbi:Glutamate-ammonia-ligase adenylyltransferase [Rhizoctonia solani]|uniref:Glutamate-ammonia-ligase adenylyltransferase n=1 Tax=Rhizoctonia solani TaxID=456999 RepID=A0A0K6G461_9AGAM|nr:Glutamate-ammonia-ligase adenylyltransferase [Rhizoctonia solani]